MIAVEQLQVTEPGVLDGIPDEVYHRDPVVAGSLSVSGARKLLPPSCPARFKYERDHPPVPKPEFDLGHAAHKVVLGTGPVLQVIEAPDWRTKAAREQRDAAHATGKVPVLAHQFEAVSDMVHALRQHPIARELLDPESMLAEQSVFWIDDASGIWRRARIDAVSRPDATGRPVIVDYKSASAGDLAHISRAMWNFGYCMQDPWYCDGAAAVGLADPDARFFFVFQEVDAPHLVTVVEADDNAKRIGREHNRRAIEIYRDCVEADLWPAYADDNEIPLVALPGWVERQHNSSDYEMEIL